MGGVCWKWGGDGRRMYEVEGRCEAYVGENCWGGGAMRGVCRGGGAMRGVWPLWWAYVD